MNCTKCGSENARIEDKLDEFTVYHCNKCNEYFKVDEPSTAEKLLWLAENKEIAIIWRNEEEYEFIFKTLVEAINAVYERAKTLKREPESWYYVGPSTRGKEEK